MDIDKFNNWSPGSSQMTCSACNRPIKLFTRSTPVNVACPSCGKIFSFASGSEKIIAAKTVIKPAIPLGTQGEINNISYQVVGFLRLREFQKIYVWSEYILYNPRLGYATLSEFDGHWNFVEETKEFPKSLSKSFEVGGNQYVFFNEYKTTVISASGEFDWEVLDAEKTFNSEFISPPFMLIREKIKDKETNWYKAKYLSTSDVKKAFNLKDYLPSANGVGANQPMKSVEDLGILSVFVTIAVGLLLLLQLVMTSYSKDEYVLSEDYTIPDSTKEKASYVTQPFKLTSNFMGQANLEFILDAPVDNNWCELAITLVNDITGEEYYFEHGVEYYYGYTGGEHWTEGSKKESKVLSSIPDGTYHLNITSNQGVPSFMPPAESTSTYVSNFHLTVIRDVPIWSNFFLIVLLIIAYPIVQHFRKRNFEYRRWQNSDFSPYDD